MKRTGAEIARISSRLRPVQSEPLGPRKADRTQQSPNAGYQPQYQALLQNSSEMVFLLDETSEIRFAAPSCLRILGYTPEELVGQGCFALMHPEDQAATRREMAAVIHEPGGSRTRGF